MPQGGNNYHVLMLNFVYDFNVPFHFLLTFCIISKE